MLNLIKNYYNKYFIFILLAIILLLAFYSYTNRFVQDDAFISLRYSFNLINGYGLVWNIGERVEGYTNFLWVLILLIPLYYGFDPIQFIYVTGPILMTINLFFAFKLAEIIFNSRNIALLTIILLGINYTFSCFATSGMETALQTALTLICYFIFVHLWLKKQNNEHIIILFSCIASLSILTRLDSVILLFIPFTGIIFNIIKQENKNKVKIYYLLYLLIPMILTLGIWFLFKYSFYNDILPNTYYLKFDNVFGFDFGLFYLYKFFESYYLIILLLIFIFSFQKFFHRENKYLIVMFITILLWFLYIIKIGGDFIEFRFFVPVLPYFFILISWVLFRFINQKELTIVLILIIIFGNFYHTKTFFALYKGLWIEPVLQLKGRVLTGNSNWIDIGRKLGYVFDYSPKIKLAVIPVGAISFYSELYIIDLLGLNDRWIAKNGIKLWNHPSHRKIGTLKYLEKKKVNLLLLTDLYKKTSFIDHSKEIRIKCFDFLELLFEEKYTFKSNPQIIEIPIKDNCYAILIYLQRDKIIDDIIEKNDFKTYSLFESNENLSLYHKSGLNPYQFNNNKHYLNNI